MTHPEMNELYELYVLNVLEPEQAREIDEHLRDGCAYCNEHLAQAMSVAAALSGLAEEHEAPAHLRRRVLAAVKPEIRGRQWTLAIAALSAACAALLLIVLWTGVSLRSSRARVAALETERRQLTETVEILSRSDTRAVEFGKAEEPHGRVFVNRNHGVVFVGSSLPQIASDRTFQLWLIPAQGAPESAGVFRPNAAGEFVQVRTEPVDLTRIHAVAVSVEPPGGSPAPTTKPVLIVPLG
ncbi:MAG TPA: anti-sigma factor [Bryobacteraceae bacterium]|jgi:anti-sigma-K factor RskA|nr:anti-sigma factor [Bryobacteraceae bacterium]